MSDAIVAQHQHMSDFHFVIWAASAAELDIFTGQMA
jgi:hypothetical protein